jgi:aminopeptidase N
MIGTGVHAQGSKVAMRTGRWAGRLLGGIAGVLLLASVASCFGSDDDSDVDLGGGPVAGPGSGEAVQAPDQAGLGDPYYPDDGNAGYDVARYDVRLDYDRDDQTIAATTLVTATADTKLSQFNLDLFGLTVDTVMVDGVEATSAREGEHELVITPDRPVDKGARFLTSVTYHGKPDRKDADSVPSGWFDATTPGGGFIAGEPHSCTLWYPCNDSPTDKAKFAVTATVPRPFSVVSNGAEGRVTPARLPGGVPARTFRWRLDEATATYLTTIYIDRLTFERSRLVDGTPVVSAYGPKPGAAPAREANLPEILAVLARRWGRYPAPQAGGIFVSGDVPFSLETYTRPIYTQGADIRTIVHENGHQWWGDNVSIKQWRDICFNECVASYSEWLWVEHQGADLDEYYREAMSDSPDFMDFPLYDMGAGNEFVFEGVYLKGTYFVHALRNLIGDDEFFAAMRGIQAELAGGNVSMNEWRDLLAEKTRTDLTSFWDEWVLTTGMPSEANLYPGDLAD